MSFFNSDVLQGRERSLSPLVKVVLVLVLSVCAYLVLPFIVAFGPMVLFAATLGVLIFLSIVYPRISLFIFSFFYVWFYDYWWYHPEPLFYVGANVYLGDIFSAAFVLSTLMIVLSRSHHPGLKNKLGLYILMYLAWVFISALRGVPNYGVSAIGESRFLIWIIAFFPVVYAIRTERQFTWFLKTFLVLVAAYTIYLQVWRYFVQFDLNLDAMLSTRIIGIDIALLLAAVFSFSFCMVVNKAHSKHKMLFIVLTVVTGMLLPFGPRSSFVAASVSTAFIFLLVFVYERRFRNLMRFILVFGALSVFVAFSGVFTDENTLGEISTRGFGFMQELETGTGTTIWRLQGWAELINQTLRSDPIFGEGLGEYYDIFSFAEQGTPPHNDWLIIFSKTGLIGLFLFCLVVIIAFRDAFRFISTQTDLKKRIYMQGLLSVFIVGLVGGSFFFFFPFTWIALGLVGALINLHQGDITPANT